MKISEILLLGALAAFAVATLIPSIEMPYSTGQTFGPGFLPLNMSVVILAITGLLVLRQFRARENADTVEGTGHRSGALPVVAAIALIVATVLLARFGSLLLPLGLCILLVTALLLGRGWRVALISTIATIAAIYVIFGLWLQIPIR